MLEPLMTVRWSQCTSFQLLSVTLNGVSMDQSVMAIFHVSVLGQSIEEMRRDVPGEAKLIIEFSDMAVLFVRSTLQFEW